MLSKSTLATALEAVAALDRDLTMAIGHTDVLAAHTYSAARSLWELRRSLERSVSSTRGLREELLGVSGDAGDVSEHYEEVALRERTAAIVTRLADLALAEYETTEDRLYSGRFRRLVEINTYLLDRIGTINEACFCARIASEAWRDDEGSEDQETRREAYRVALGAARDAFLAIGNDEDVARFFRIGATVASEPFRLACQSIATLLELSPGAGQPDADLENHERGI